MEWSNTMSTKKSLILASIKKAISQFFKRRIVSPTLRGSWCATKLKYWNKSTTIFVKLCNYLFIFTHVYLLLYLLNCLNCTCSFALIVSNNNETNTRWVFCDCWLSSDMCRPTRVSIIAGLSFLLSNFILQRLFLATLPPVGLVYYINKHATI